MESSLERLRQWSNERLNDLASYQPVQVFGRVIKINGIALESILPFSKIGDLCSIESSKGENVLAEIIGFNTDTTLLSSLGNLQGVEVGARVTPFSLSHHIQISDRLMGSVLDGFGRSLNSDVSAFSSSTSAANATPVICDAVAPTERPRIDSPLPTGLRVIDALLTLGEGQRVGIFAGAGCGKTTLLAEIARNTPCDVIVFGLIGERGRELREFLDHELDAQLRAKSVLVCSTSDRTSMERARAAFTATAIAEGFRAEGKSVLLLIDSLTRFARAQREIGLAAGEPPGRGGFPPSVYSLLPRLVERAGKTKQGSITALYTVLIEQDSMSDPVADEVRSLLDGHIVLSRKLAEKNHYPAVDVLSSISRTMPNVTPPEHMACAGKLRTLMASYKEVEMLIRLGEYQQGNDPLVDTAVAKNPDINRFLQQRMHEPSDYSTTLNLLEQVSAGVPE